MFKFSNFIKSKTDNRLYRYIRLQNSLRCLLVTDPDTQKSSCSLNLQVGNLVDDKTKFGIAHFCEHMLFLGTTKYPNETEYSSFIKDHGGSKNAFTANGNTNYYFDIANEHFFGALDRFAQFFISPLFNEDSTAREMKAVDSEYRKNLQNDYRRSLQIFLTESNPDSAFNRFSTGSLETLDYPTIREDLMKYHEKYYSSNLMTVVLVGKEELNVLEEWAVKFFSEVPNKDAKLPDFSNPPTYPPEYCGRLFKIFPVKDKDILKLIFSLPPSKLDYKIKPLNYISHLCGHEGPNSLLSLLIDEKYALSLTSGGQHYQNAFDTFYITIELTNLGREQYLKVLSLVFSYIQMLQSQEPSEYIFEESKKMDTLGFEYKNKEHSIIYSRILAERMYWYSEEVLDDLLIGPYVAPDFNSQYIKKFIDQLTPENCNIFFSSVHFKDQVDKTEKWYSSKYSQQKFSPELLEAMTHPSLDFLTSSKKLGLPPPNKLIPKSLDILPKEPEPKTEPEIIREEEGSTVWYKQDHKFDVPKTYGNCNIYTKDGNFPYSEDYTIFLSIFSMIFKEDIREFSYMAELAKVSCHFSFSNTSLKFSFAGFNDSIPEQLDQYLNKLKEFKLEGKESIYDDKYQKYLKIIKNEFLADPYIYSGAQFQCFLKSMGSVTNRHLKSLESFTFVKFCKLFEEFLKNCRFKWFISGNLSKEQCLGIVDNCEGIIKGTSFPEDEIVPLRAISIPKKTQYYYVEKSTNPNQVNSCMISYFQGEPYFDSNLHNFAVHSVLCNYLTQKAFNQLRTQEQLGYIVFCNSYNICRVLGCRILVQSSVAAPELLYQRINAFLSMMQEQIKDLSEEELQKQIEAVEVKYKQIPLSLFEETSQFWAEISFDDLLFNRNQEVIETLHKINIQDVIQHFNNLFFEKMRRFDFQYVSTQHLEIQEKYFKENQEQNQKNNLKRIEITSENQMRKINYIFPNFHSFKK